MANSGEVPIEAAAAPGEMDVKDPLSSGIPPTSDLIYGLEDVPPLQEALFAALQHVLACFIGIVTPSLIIGGALGLDAETTAYLVSMSLFVSGIAAFYVWFMGDDLALER